MLGKRGKIEFRVLSPPGGCDSIGPGGGQSLGPGGGQSFGPGGGKSLLRDRRKGLNPDTMRPYKNPYR